MQISEVTTATQREVWRLASDGTATAYIKKCRTDFAKLRFESGIHAQNLAKAVGLQVPNIRSAHFPFVVEQAVPGRPLADLWTGVSETRRLKILEMIGKFLNSLHSIRGNLFSENTFEKSGEEWKVVLTKRADRLQSEMNRNQRTWVHNEIKTLPSEICPALVHFDLNPNNIIYSEREGLWVIDFESARFYDPLWDLLIPLDSLCGTNPSRIRSLFNGYFGNGFEIPNQIRRRINLYFFFHQIRESNYLE